MSTLRAVIVGFNNFDHMSTHSLRFAEADAASFAEGLQSQSAYDRCEVDLISRRRTGREIESMTRMWGVQSRPEDALLVFFAGHGIVEEVDAGGHGLFLACADTDLNDVPATAIDLQRLVQNLESAVCVNAFVLLDCCFSGANGGRSILGPQYLRRLQTGRPFRKKRIPTPSGAGRVVLAACGFTQKAVESSVLQHGVFTHALISTVQSKPHTASISIAALYHGVQQKVLQLTNGAQCPSLYGGDHGAQFPRFHGGR